MRKRDKKKEKAKAELVARKRKELYEDVAPQGRRTEKGVGSEEGGKKKLGHRQRVGFFRELRILWRLIVSFLICDSNVYRLRRVKRSLSVNGWRKRRLV